jgi:hypothetical protein
MRGRNKKILMSSALAIFLAGSLAVFGTTVFGQAAQVVDGSGTEIARCIPPHSEVVREIDDPHTGDQWLLMRNDLNPGGPGRMVLMSLNPASAKISSKSPSPSRSHSAGTLTGTLTVASVARGQASQAFHPVIRSGDLLIVEEHTAILDTSLEAVALAPAEAGAALNVRLKIGGKVLRALALSAGRAVLQPESGVRP